MNNFSPPPQGIARWGLLLLTLFAFRANAQEADIALARVWFEQNHAQPDYQGYPVSANWGAARIVHREESDHWCYEVPLKENRMSDIGDLGDQDLHFDDYYSNGYVRLVVEQKSDKYVAYFVRVNAFRKYVEAFGKETVSSSTFDRVSNNFSGQIEYIGMDGYSIQGAILQDGMPIGTVCTVTQGNAAPANDRCLVCGSLPTIVTFWQQAYSSTGSLIGPPTLQSYQTTSWSCWIDQACTELPFIPPGWNGNVGSTSSDVFHTYYTTGYVWGQQSPPPPPNQQQPDPLVCFGQVMLGTVPFGAEYQGHWEFDGYQSPCKIEGSVAVFAQPSGFFNSPLFQTISVSADDVQGTALGSSNEALVKFHWTAHIEIATINFFNNSNYLSNTVYKTVKFDQRCCKY